MIMDPVEQGDVTFLWVTELAGRRGSAALNQSSSWTWRPRLRVLQHWQHRARVRALGILKVVTV